MLTFGSDLNRILFDLLSETVGSDLDWMVLDPLFEHSYVGPTLVEADPLLTKSLNFKLL